MAEAISRSMIPNEKISAAQREAVHLSMLLASNSGARYLASPKWIRHIREKETKIGRRYRQKGEEPCEEEKDEQSKKEKRKQSKQNPANKRHKQNEPLTFSSIMHFIFHRGLTKVTNLKVSIITNQNILRLRGRKKGAQNDQKQQKCNIKMKQT